MGTVWANRNPDYKQYPYVIKYDDPDTRLLYTDMVGHNVRHGDPEDAQLGIRIPGEIWLVGVTHESRSPSDEKRVRDELLAKNRER